MAEMEAVSAARIASLEEQCKSLEVEVDTLREGERQDEALIKRYHETQAQATTALQQKEREIEGLKGRLGTAETALADERRTGNEGVDFYRGEVKRMEALLAERRTEAR